MKRARAGDNTVVDLNMAHVLMLLSRGAEEDLDPPPPPPPSERVFECKTCNRRFPSFQALGGHRASHKKPKLFDDAGRPPVKPRVHECPICGLEFELGQALGGHMRRHRAAGPPPVPPHQKVAGKSVVAPLDLNLTPMENEAEVRLLDFGLGLPLVH